MINLLPPANKQAYHYARRNRHLLHWITGAVAGLAGLAVLTWVGLLYMNHSIASYTDTVATSTEVLKEQHVDAIEAQVQDISNNLKLVVQVLSHEILFADLLKQMATVTPSNVILTGISIAQTENAINITAQSTSYASGTQLVANLNDPSNKIFSEADLINASCPDSASSSKYSCTVTIRALFSPNNPYLFINSKKAAS